jgi:hypothetical protein
MVVSFSGRPYAAFGIQNNWNVWVELTDIGDGLFQCWFGGNRGIVRKLRFKTAGQVRGGVDDGLIKGENIAHSDWKELW